MIDLSKFHVVDISDKIKNLVPPTWYIAQSSEHLGRDLRELENEIAAGLGIKWPVIFGDEFQGMYEQESDCASVVVGMVRRRPGLELFVKCSDPEWRPPYRPVAHFEIK